MTNETYEKLNEALSDSTLMEDNPYTALEMLESMGTYEYELEDMDQYDITLKLDEVAENVDRQEWLATIVNLSTSFIDVDDVEEKLSEKGYSLDDLTYMSDDEISSILDDDDGSDSLLDDEYVEPELASDVNEVDPARQAEFWDQQDFEDGLIGWDGPYDSEDDD